MLQNLHLTIECGHYDNKIDVRSNTKSETIIWSDLLWQFPVTEKHFVKFVFLSGSVTKPQEYGQFIFKCAELTTLVKDTTRDNEIVLLLDVHNNKSMIHKVRLHCTVSMEGDWLHVDDYLERLAHLKKETPLLSGYSHTHNSLMQNKSITAGANMESALNKTMSLSPVKSPVKSPQQQTKKSVQLNLTAESDYNDIDEEEERNYTPSQRNNMHIVKQSKNTTPDQKNLRNTSSTPGTVDSRDLDTFNTTRNNTLNNTMNNTFNSDTGNYNTNNDNININSSIYPFRLTVTDIVASDLKSVHMLTANSPHVNIAVGTTANSTSSVSLGGAASQWNGLNFVYFIHQTNTIRIAAWSKNTCIGAKSVDPTELLDCVTDSLNYREYYCNVYTTTGSGAHATSIMTGKVKITFMLEHFETYNTPVTELHTLVMPFAPEPPVLITVYTVAVMNCRSVHPFSKNHPVIKGSVTSPIQGGNNWKRATSADNEHIGTSAKWEGLMWSIIFDSLDTKLKLVVLSGSIVVGSVALDLAQLIAQSTDSSGLCEIECYISTASNGNSNSAIVNPKDKNTAVTEKKDKNISTVESGMLRLTYSYEAHTDVEINSDSDSDSEYITNNNFNNSTSINDNLNGGSSILSGSQSLVTAGGGNIGSAAGNNQRNNTKLKLVHGTILSMGVTGLKSVHSLTANSPFVTVKCGEFRAVTKTQYLSGSTASWLQLALHFSILESRLSLQISSNHTSAPEATLALAIYSAAICIGTVSYTQAELLSAPRDNFGCVIVNKQIMSDQGEYTGTLTIKIKINDSALKNNDKNTDELQNANNSSNNNNSGMPPLQKLTLPFTLKIHNIFALDILAGVTEEFFYKNRLLLQVGFEGWTKQTPAAQQDLVMQTVTAEWADGDWLFVVTDKLKALEFTLMSSNVTLGKMVLFVQDLFKAPMDGNNHIEISNYLIGSTGNNNHNNTNNDSADREIPGNPVSIGKLKVNMSVAPYVTPAEKLKQISDLLTAQQNKHVTSRLIGKIRIKHLKLSDLFQIYGLFKNSPKVTVVFSDNNRAVNANVLPRSSQQTTRELNSFKGSGSGGNTNWSCSTPIAVDAGSEHTWNALSWGLIPIYADHTFHIKVTSGNEIIGEHSMSSEDFIACLQRIPGAITPTVQGELMDGVVGKGLYEIGCLLIIDSDCHKSNGSNSGFNSARSSDRIHNNTPFHNTVQLYYD